MDRHLQATKCLVALCLLTGCMGSRSSVRDAATGRTQDILTDGPSLLPPMPMQSSGATRGQMPEALKPVAPAAASTPVTQTSAMSPSRDQLAVRIRAHVNGTPILDDEVREALVLHMNELIQTPESQRAAVYKEMTKREIDHLVERELILQDAFTRIKELKKP